MDEQVLKDQIKAAFEGRKGEFELIKASIEKFVMAILGDAKGVIVELPELDDAVNLAISTIDDITNTGIFDLIDAPIAKMVASKLINDKARAWYKDERTKLLQSAQDAGI